METIQAEVIKTRKELLFNAPIPAVTDSYMPVPNHVLVNELGEALDKKNMKIVDEFYSHNRELTQMFGTMTLAYGDSEQQMSIGFRNSYDKSLAVGFVAGSRVIVCSNLCFGGDIKVLRKHTSGVIKDLDEVIQNVIGYSENEFEKMLRDSNQMKNVELNKTLMARLAGQMFVEEELLNSVQMSIMKKEINMSEHFTDPTLWSFYNHTTEALKKSHPALVMQNHVDVHNYLKDKFKLA